MQKASSAPIAGKHPSAVSSIGAHKQYKWALQEGMSTVVHQKAIRNVCDIEMVVSVSPSGCCTGRG